MDIPKSLKIAQLEVDRGLLLKEERRLQEIIASSFSSPEIKSGATEALSRTLANIEKVAAEIVELEGGQ
jgi:hypothetical protein